MVKQIVRLAKAAGKLGAYLLGNLLFWGSLLYLIVFAGLNVIALIVGWAQIAGQYAVPAFFGALIAIGLICLTVDFVEKEGETR